MSEELKTALDAATGNVTGTAEEAGQQAATEGTPKSQAEELFGDTIENTDASTETPEKVESDKPQESGKEGDLDPELEKLKPSKDVPQKPFEGEIGGYKLKLPEGVAGDNPEVVEFAGIMKECDVKGDKAQKLLDVFVENRKRTFEHLATKEQEFREKIDAQWIEENKKDPEFGGAQFEQTANYVQAAIRRFLTKEEILSTQAEHGKMGFLEFLTAANIRNAPPLVRFLARVGKRTGEATPITSGVAPRERRVQAKKDVLFGEIDG